MSIRTTAEQATAWTTKYALTKGIECLQGEVTSDGYFYHRSGYGWSTQYARGEWHRTESEAVETAEKMRVRRIMILRKQIAKWEQTRFMVAESTSNQEGTK